MLQQRSLFFLLSSIFFLLSIAALIYFYPPTFQFSIPILSTIEGLNAQLSILNLFFLLLFLFLFSSGSFLFKSKKHGFLFSLLIMSYLIFRLNNLTHPFFAVLLIALFLTLELLFSYKK